MHDSSVTCDIIENNYVYLNVLLADGVHTGLSWSWIYQKTG